MEVHPNCWVSTNRKIKQGREIKGSGKGNTEILWILNWELTSEYNSQESERVGPVNIGRISF